MTYVTWKTSPRAAPISTTTYSSQSCGERGQTSGMSPHDGAGDQQGPPVLAVPHPGRPEYVPFDVDGRAGWSWAFDGGYRRIQGLPEQVKMARRPE